MLPSGLFKNQITTLVITICYNHDNDDYDKMILSVVNICDYIFTVFTCLITFVLYESSNKNRVRLNFDDPFLPNFRSSTLLKLTISVLYFDDCLYLLDGRFNQLHTLRVDLFDIHQPDEIENKVSFTKFLYYQIVTLYFLGRFTNSKVLFSFL
jgi:hypothetical protein